MIIVENKGSKLVSSNVPDDSLQFYDNATTYSKNDNVVEGNHVYICLADNTVEVTPSSNAVVWWKDRPINRYAMLDGWNDTATVHSSDIVCIFDTTDIDNIALFGVEAQSVRVQLVSNTTSEVLYDETHMMQHLDITDWYENTYAQSENKKKLRVEVPIYLDARLTVTIKAIAGTARCSNMVMGKSKYLGGTQWGGSVSRSSNTRRDRNRRGRVYLSKGNGWSKIAVPIQIATNAVTIFEERLEEIDGTPTLFVGDDRVSGIESMMVYGFYRDYEIPITITRSTYTLNIEGVG